MKVLGIHARAAVLATRQCLGKHLRRATAGLALIPGTALCGAPFQTDDPNVVAFQHAEVLAYYQSTLTGTGRLGTLPGLELHYGAFERTEFDLIAPYAFSFPPGGATAHGYGDTVVGGKYSLISADDDTFLLSAVPKIRFPTGNASRGLGSGGSAVFLALAAQQTIDDFQTYANAGYWINNGAGNQNYWFVGWAAQYKVSECWTLGAEVFYNGPEVVGQVRSVGFNVGGYFSLTPQSQLLFSMGRGLTNAAVTNRVSAYVGGQINF